MVNSKLFHIQTNIRKISVGDLLLAQPLMADNTFSRTAILITEQSREDGTVGVIMNTIFNSNSEFIELYFPNYDGPIYYGGPVHDGEIFYLHTLDFIPDSIKICEGLYWGGDYDLIRKLLNDRKINSKDLRLFLGYSGWTAGQLENEIVKNQWLNIKINASDLLSMSHQKMWEESINRLGQPYKLWSSFPVNPSNN